MITTGKQIYDLLKASEVLVALVGLDRKGQVKIYPLIAPENTTAPYIIYSRSFNNQNTKDGLAYSDSSIDITVTSAVYSESINISTAVFNALTGQARLENGSEAWENSAYVQYLNFSFRGV